MSIRSINIFALCLFASLHIATSQIPGLGGCPKINVVQNFDANRYLGRWYEVKKYPFIFTLGGKCVIADYGLNPNGTVSVFNSQVRNGKQDTILGSARVIKQGEGVLGVTFPNVPIRTEANYNVLATDYDTYAVVYSCSSLFSFVNGKVVWILSRVRFPPQSLLDHAYEVMKANGLSTSHLATTDNTGCPDEVPQVIPNFRH